MDVGGLQIDGLGDGVWMILKVINLMSIRLLWYSSGKQDSYIENGIYFMSSCGRTLFDLQETTAKIRKRTDHLKGIKIGIMGCIVNGPGEMADADYGYVGTGPGLISL